MRTIFWFRRDLRITDNTGLSQACDAADDGVVGLFVVTPGQWKRHDDAAAKIQFWLQNLISLKDDLAKLNIPLQVLTVDDYESLPRRISTLAKDFRCDALFLNREYEVNEHRRDDQVADALAAEGIAVHRFHDRAIVPPDLILNGQPDVVPVFTDYRERWDRMLPSSALPPPTPTVQSKTEILSSTIPLSIDGFDDSTYRDGLWCPGEQVAKTKLDKFAKRIGAYSRNRDTPSISGTSVLSPYLAAGVLSPRQCLKSALECCGGSLSRSPGAATWVSELAWRDFYSSILVAFPRVSMHQPLDQRTNVIRWRYDESDFQAWCQGRTGYPFVDAGMRQLNRTGWMHNRMRMVTAMFLSKHLLIDWRWGERYFMNKLIDGDLAANNGGWQWCASTGTDSAPHLRLFNPFSQSKRFDPEAVYIKRFCPELSSVSADVLHDPIKLKKTLGNSPSLLSEESIDYPNCIVDHKAARQRALEAFEPIST